VNVAVVGATGAVGTRMLQVLAERSFPADSVRALASERSAGKEVKLGDDTIRVEALDAVDLSEFDLALFSAGGGVSEEWAPKFVAAGAVVVDNSSFWRMHDDVPLVVAEVNPDAIESHRGIVANPNCSTMQMVVALKPIDDAAGIERLVISTYQSVSGTGQKAVDELVDQAHMLLHQQEPEAPSVYPHRIAFNVLPQVEKFKDGDDYTTEERKMMAETRKILGHDDIGISATCARVPVLVGHSQAVWIETEEPLPPGRAREVLEAAPGVRVTERPTAREAAGGDEVLVGRIRADTAGDGLALWIVCDNLRKGAALNAIQIAELLLERRAVAA
jgi:aspartate-semialdehyde dehydrogenase